MYERTATQVRLAWFAVWLLQIEVLVKVWADNRWTEVQQGGGEAWIALGALAGLLGAFCLLTQLVLISGWPPIERAFGLDRLARMHHKNGFIGYSLIMTHVLLIVGGYSLITGQGIISQYFALTRSLPYVLLAAFAFWALNAVVLSSIVIVRRRLRYEWWRTVHWLVYAVIVLSFWHQINNGAELLGSQWLRYYWYFIYAFALSVVIYMRLIRPLLLYRRYGFRVDRVEKEADGVNSIYVTGRGLDNFRYWAGQFNFWYFWQPGLRLQKHPFTISSSPGSPYLRLTPKAVGDYTRQLAELRPGTPVLINGPFGRFSMMLSSTAPRLFIAGGIGITPLRSMIGDGVAADDVLLYCARRSADLAFRQDFDEMADKRGLTLYYVLSEEKAEGENMRYGQLDNNLLESLVPDLATRDVWLCGPPAMMRAVSRRLRYLGVPARRIHTERFEL
jgi:predicted ferric reductase